VNVGAIEDALRADGLGSVEAIGGATHAGTGCGGCQGKIAEILDAMSGAGAVPASKAA
jgi:nitrogenase molybdenum-cofactor synthesis protein NifE